MFTGIVQDARPVSRFDAHGTHARVVVDLGNVLVENVSIGASIAIDGTCLTVVEVNGSEVVFDVIQGTLERTILCGYQAGVLVNVERSMRAGDEIGGHEVSGHVDCRAVVESVEVGEGNTRLTLSLDPEWMRYVFPHGFIAVNGTSLTISDIDKQHNRFTIWLIPETLRRTNLSKLEAGKPVNIEIHRATQVAVDAIYDAVARVIHDALEKGDLSNENVGKLVGEMQKLSEKRKD